MAVYDIAWDTIAANSATDWYIYGFTAKEAVSFSIVVFPGSGAVRNPLAHATLTQGEAYQHVDGSKAYKIYIRNHAAFNACNVHILAQAESL